jgi:hypothetical protein
LVFEVSELGFVVVPDLEKPGGWVWWLKTESVKVWQLISWVVSAGAKDCCRFGCFFEIESQATGLLKRSFEDAAWGRNLSKPRARGLWNCWLKTVSSFGCP